MQRVCFVMPLSAVWLRPGYWVARHSEREALLSVHCIPTGRNAALFSAPSLTAYFSDHIGMIDSWYCYVYWVTFHAIIIYVWRTCRVYQ